MTQTGHRADIGNERQLPDATQDIATPLGNLCGQQLGVLPDMASDVALLVIDELPPGVGYGGAEIVGNARGGVFNLAHEAGEVVT